MPTDATFDSGQQTGRNVVRILIKMAANSPDWDAIKAI
jgi:hypothetical protein